MREVEVEYSTLFYSLLFLFSFDREELKGDGRI